MVVSTERTRAWLGLAATFVACASVARDRAADLADFEFLTSRIEANYAGWETKTAGARRAELDALTSQVREEIARARDDADFRESLERWAAWFDDGHLQLQWAATEDAPPWHAGRRSLDEAEVRARLQALGVARSPIEGLWTIDDRYRLAVLRRGGPHTFDAIVLATSAEGWSAGDIKATLTPTSDGRFDVRYGAGDRTELRMVATLRARDAVLDLGELGLWRRVHDDPAEALAGLRRWPGDEFTVTRLDADTLYLRLPSFHDSHTDTVRALLEAHAAELARTPHLVVDVRNNGGGSDFVYDPVLPWLYTQPIYRVGVDVRVSADNQRLRREVADALAEASPEAARVLRGESERMASATTPFIRREPPVEIVRLREVRPNPLRVAVLIDRAGSSAESFLLDARQSRKVTLLGQENSSGVLDFGEMMGTTAPSGRFRLAWATTRSLRLPVDPVDPDGIAPDVRIPAEVDDPVAFAVEWLKKK